MLGLVACYVGTTFLEDEKVVTFFPIYFKTATAMLFALTSIIEALVFLLQCGEVERQLTPR